MEPILFIGRSLPALGRKLANALNVEPGECRIEEFADGEIRVEVKAEIETRTVLLLQSTASPAGRNILELLLLADACRRRGARHIIAIIPYFGYARQDRRVTREEPIGARLVTDLLATRCDRILTFDLHTAAIEGFASVPLLHLSAVPLLAEAFRENRHRDCVLVAPDAGAVKLVMWYGKLLQLPVAYLEKVRKNDQEVAVQAVTGEVKDHLPVLVDDMISSGGTMAAAIDALLNVGARPEISIIVSHCLLVGQAATRLAQFPIRRIITTDSIPVVDAHQLPITRYSLAQILADTLLKLFRTEVS
jgi:ribose-phosphate pyrophosphokinase